MKLSSKPNMERQAGVAVRGAIAASLVAVGFSALVSCGKSELPVYETSQEREYLGSVYYAKSDCAGCHGAEWNGEGPDAKRMKAVGMNPTNFTVAAPASKTPKDYFLAVTDPVGYFKANKPEGASEKAVMAMASGHKYLTYTDKARWNMANFLYNLAPAPEDTAARKQALSEMEAEVAEVYDGNRRWQIGFPTVEERAVRPGLEDLIKKASVRIVEENTPAEVSDARMAVRYEKSEGAELFANNCASCHGNYAEGKKLRYGLNGMIPMISGFPRVETLTRQEAVFVTTPDLNRSAALSSQESFKGAHKTSSGMLAPVFTGFTSAEWGALHQYTRRLAGK